MSESSSKRGVFSDAAAPGDPRQAIGQQHPQQLREQGGPDGRAGDLAHVNGDGHVKHGRKRGASQHLLERGRQQVQRKQMAAGQVFEGEQDEVFVQFSLNGPLTETSLVAQTPVVWTAENKLPELRIK